MVVYSLDILDVRMELRGDVDGLVETFAKFDEAYDLRCWRDAPSAVIRVRIRACPALLGEIKSLPGRDEVDVHRAPYPQWRLRGAPAILPSGPGYLVRSEGFAIAIDNVGDVEILFEAGRDLARLGEVLHLLFRNLASFRRSADAGVLVHASCTVDGSGAVVHLGPSGAGKTEGLLENVLLRGHAPLSNDRLCIDLHTLEVHSWPSYLTFYPSTAERHAALRAAMPAGAAADGVKVFLTPADVARACGQPYQRSAKLAQLYLMDGPWTSERAFVPLDRFNAAELAEAETLLQQESFDDKEPSFAPWHGWSMPACRPDWRAFLQRAASAGVSIWRVQSLREMPAPAPFRAEALAE